MTLEFVKMNGAGNDFVLIDNRDGTVQLNRAQIVQLCHRQRGIGADGLFLLVPCRSGKARWAWDFYNNDGSTAAMCGNGARCFARFIQMVTGDPTDTSFETGAGVIQAHFEGSLVRVGLTPPRDLRLSRTVRLTDGEVVAHSLNTGVPHAALFVEDADRAMVTTVGPQVRYHPDFGPSGTNVNFVQVLGPNAIRVRTYERGVEGETLACGTGVTACALISARLHGFESPISVRVQGGDTLQVSFAQKGDHFEDVHLTGPADFVFEGKITI